MRKFALLLSLIFVLGVFGGLAEGINLKSLTDGELESLYDNLKEEMLDRGILRSGDLQEGWYIVGKDIAAGSYIVDKVEGGYGGNFIILPNEDYYKEYLHLFDIIQIYPSMTSGVYVSEPKKQDFVEGNVIYVEYPIHLEEVRNRLMP